AFQRCWAGKVAARRPPAQGRARDRRHRHRHGEHPPLPRADGAAGPGGGRALLHGGRGGALRRVQVAGGIVRGAVRGQGGVLQGPGHRLGAGGAVDGGGGGVGRVGRAVAAAGGARGGSRGGAGHRPHPPVDDPHRRYRRRLRGAGRRL
ncbi:MAG: Holo-[acyl-carrier-protein] synthase, partial [uncultured Gemmatimonadetes bacterium]